VVKEFMISTASPRMIDLRHGSRWWLVRVSLRVRVKVRVRVRGMVKVVDARKGRSMLVMMMDERCTFSTNN
jgi:hypothetical protein